MARSLQLFIKPLRSATPAIIGPERIDNFIWQVFHNWMDVLAIHRQLLDRMARRQQEHHPVITGVNDLVFDALMQWGDAYREYAANYPIAKWRVDKERRNNPAFADFFDVRPRDVSWVRR